MGMARRLLRRLPSIRGWPLRPFRSWPLWSLPRLLLVFVLTVIAMGLAAVGVAASLTPIRVHDLTLFGLLLGCMMVAVELTRKAGEESGNHKDVQGVWELPVAIVLPPLYSLLVPIAGIALLQFRVRRALVYRRVFSWAAVGLSYAAASVTFHALSGLVPRAPAATLWHGIVWTLLVAVAVLAKLIVNKTTVMTAVKGSNPKASIRTEIFSREPMYNDMAEICIGVLLTYGVTNNPLLAVVALPVVTLLQRSLRHVQLLNDSRADSKTGLLNAATWERESATEVARAVRTKSPLAVALLDIDKFKAVNDTYGHMVGDQVLKEIAATLNTLLRDYDRAGRFGGEEFSLLLPQTRAVDAFRIAERVRAKIASQSFTAPAPGSGEPVHVTVSIGVAALDAGSRRQLPELLAAADAALYRAKACGRDQVQMISTTRGLSAISGGGSARGSGSHQDAPSAFRRAQSS